MYKLIHIQEDGKPELLFKGTKKECEHERDDVYAPIFGGVYQVIEIF